MKSAVPPTVKSQRGVYFPGAGTILPLTSGAEREATEVLRKN